MQTAFDPRRAPFGPARKFIIMSCLLAGCASAPVKVDTPAEILRRDAVEAAQLAPRVEARAAFRRDPAVTDYLRELAMRLAETSPLLRGTTVETRLVSDPEGRWRNYALPGTVIYVSVESLRAVQYENELAAALAIELGHVLRRTVMNRLASDAGSSESLPLFSPGGIFAYSPEELSLAVESGLELLYQAGYDPRGMITLLNRYESQLDRSPYPGQTAAALVEKSRRIIALQAPLRNPIIRSERFRAVFKRMQRL